MRYLIVIIFFLAACNNNANKTESAQPIKDSIVKDSIEAEVPVSSTSNARELTTSTGKKVVVTESHPVGMSMSDITVFFKEDTTTKLTLKDKNPVSNVLVADLDQNGFDEVYVITTVAGSGSYGDVHGFYSNKDQSFSFISMPEITEKDLAKGGLYEGYEGHDVIAVNNKQLTRTFPVKADKKQSERSISYTLKKTETGFVFSPVK